MIRRFIACALAALLLMLAAGPALADTYTLEQKFIIQAFQQSAYRGTVTFAVSGDRTAAIGDAEWLMLKNLAPRISLSLEHTTTRERDEGQAAVTLLLDGKSNIKTNLLYDEKLLGVSSTLLSGENAYYTVARDWDLTRLAQSLTQGDSAWPPVWRMILAVENAPEAWKAKAKERIGIYETKLGLWMNGYASFSAGRENNTAYSQLSCVIPAQAVKAEIKQLMVDFYNDSELLTLLREVVTAQEAAAYLQPGGMNSLFGMLDTLKLEGSVEVVRRYDAMGNALLDSISLPFAESGLFSRIKVSVSGTEAGKTWKIQGALNSGAEFDVSCLTAEDHIFTGAVEVMLPEDETASFVVSDGTAGRKSIAFDYSLSWDPGEDQYTLSTDRFAREMRGTLLIRPKGETALPEQSVTLEASLSSGSSQRSATQLNGTVTWRDMESGASIRAELTSRTVSPFAYNTPSSLTGAMRLDLLTQETRAAVVQSWASRASSVLAQLLGSGAGLINFATVQPR